jgi:beta-lactamase class A
MKQLESRSILSPLPAQLGFVALLIALLSLPGCSKAGPSTTDLSAQQSERRNDRLEQQIKEIAADAKGHVGVAAVLVESGETIASLNSHDHFPMQSVYKLPISMAVMAQVDQGKLTLDQKVRVTKEDYVPRLAYSPIRDKFPNGTELTVDELLRFALSESDGTASDVLLRLAGGPTSVQMYVTDLPVADMIVLNTEKELAADWQAQYRNSATPDSGVALLRALSEKRGLSEPSQALLLKYMIESAPGANRLKGLLPPGTIVAHKTGTSGTNQGITAATNDIGLITLPGGKHLAIAVFVSDSPADEATREGVIAKTAKAVWDSVANR